MHFIDGRPYGHLIWGEGLHPLDDYIETLNRNHYEGYLGQELTVVDYWFDPAQTDRKNMQAFAPYIKD
jgi:protein FrlC